jgi:ribosome-binding factor A
MAALRSASGFIRRILKPRMHTRQIPELEFRDDRSMEHAETIARTLNEVHRSEAASVGRKDSAL